MSQHNIAFPASHVPSAAAQSNALCLQAARILRTTALQWGMRGRPMQPQTKPTTQTAAQPRPGVQALAERSGCLGLRAWALGRWPALA